MITFKQYLSEIDMIDGKEYTTHDSDNRASEHDHKIKKANAAEFGYKPFESSFSNRDYELLEHTERNELTIILVHKKTRDAAITLMLEKTTIKLNGKNFTFWSTDVLSGLKKYQGQGLAPLIYQAVINSGRYVIGSSHEQTEGGAKTWTKLLKVIDEPVYVAAMTDYAIANVPAAKELKMNKGFVLLKGKLDELKGIAYDSYQTRFIVIPANLEKDTTSSAIDATGTKLL